MAKVDFLTPGTREIRHQIRNVVDSYNNDWDIFAELAQNAVDAITVQKPIKGHISVSIDATSRTITFEDNGCGISPVLMPKLLAPFSSGKSSVDLIGNKGVGITFVIFSSSYFEITSHSSAGSSKATIEGAWAWIDSQTDELPKLESSELPETSDFGTRISICLPKDIDFPIFELDFEQIAMVLRTKTALGDTGTIWGKKSDKDFVLSVTDLNGTTVTREIECEYFLPIEKLSKSAYISLREFQDWNTGDRTDSQKRQKLRDKVIYIENTVEKSGRKIRYWACFVPKRAAWDIISVNSKLVSDDILSLNPVERIEKYSDQDYLFSGGMFTSTRGMPTGIRSEMRTKGSGGYIPNFFILLDDPQLSFDIGRKSIPGRQLGMLRDTASDVFRDFLNGIKKYIGGEPEVDSEAWERSKIFTEIRKLPELNSKLSLFQRRPFAQEASVAAIFYELIGNKGIEGFKPLISGYHNKYDLYSTYNGADVVLEFKQSLGGLFGDFDDEVKLFDQIDIVVIWDVTERDRVIVASRGLDLQEIEPGLSSKKDNIFHFNLVLGPTKPIRIVCIRRILE